MRLEAKAYAASGLFSPPMRLYWLQAYYTVGQIRWLGPKIAGLPNMDGSEINPFIGIGASLGA